MIYNLRNRLNYDLLGHIKEFNSAYNANCNKDLTKKGLLFYASLNGNTPNLAETGQLLISNGTISYQEFNSIQAAYFNNSYLTFDTYEFPSGNQDRTISLLACSTNSNSIGMIFSYGSLSSNPNNIEIFNNNGNLIAGTRYTDLPNLNQSIYNLWNHIVFIINDNKTYIYCNNILILNGDSSINYNTSLENGCIGSRVGSFNFQGYISDVRVYNRVISLKEITNLFNQYNL